MKITYHYFCLIELQVPLWLAIPGAILSKWAINLLSIEVTSDYVLRILGSHNYCFNYRL